MPSFWHSLGPSTLSSRPCCLATFCATSAILVGVRSPAGSLMRSRARPTPAATWTPRCVPRLSASRREPSTLSGEATSLTSSTLSGFFLSPVRYSIELVAAEDRALGEELRGALGGGRGGATLEIREHRGHVARLRGGARLDDARGEPAQIGRLQVLARAATDEEKALRTDAAVRVQRQGLPLFALELLVTDEAAEQPVETLRRGP